MLLPYEGSRQGNRFSIARDAVFALLMELAVRTRSTRYNDPRANDKVVPSHNASESMLHGNIRVRPRTEMGHSRHAPFVRFQSEPAITAQSNDVMCQTFMPEALVASGCSAPA